MEKPRDFFALRVSDKIHAMPVLSRAVSSTYFMMIGKLNNSRSLSIFLESANKVTGILDVDFEEAYIIKDTHLLQPPEIGAGGAPVASVYGVAPVEKKFRQVRAVLAGDAGDKCRFRHCGSFPW